MQLLIYLLLCFVLSVGFLIGAYISKEAEEELAQGFIYFRILNIILVYIIFLITSITFFEDKLIGIITSLIIVTLFLIPEKIKIYTTTLIMALTFFMFSKVNDSYIIPALIFSQSMFSGTLIYFKEKKYVLKKLLVNLGIFLITSLILSLSLKFI